MNRSTGDIDQLQRKLAATPSRRERIAVLIDSSRRILAADPIGALQVAERALEMALSLGDAPLRAASLQMIGRCHAGAGDYDQAIETLRTATEVSKEIDEPGIEANVALAFGETYRTKGRFRDAIAAYQRALPLFESIDDVDGTIGARNALAEIYSELGDDRTALELLQRNLRALDGTAPSESIGAVLGNIARIHGRLGDAIEARRRLEEALGIARAIGNRLLEADTIANLCSTCLAAGDVEIALEHGMLSMAIYETLGDNARLARSAINVGSAYEQQGQLDVALSYQLMALGVLDRIGSDREQAMVYLNIGRLYRRIDKNGDAAYVLEQGLMLARESGDLALQKSIVELLADVAESANDMHRAVRYLRQAKELETSLQTTERQRAITELQIRFDLERAEQKKELYRLRAEGFEREVERKQSELSAIMLQLVEKGAFLNKLRERLKKFEKEGDEAFVPLIDELDATIRQNIDSSDDWKRFEKQFEQVHHEFIRTLSKRYPALSPTELRVCALMRANLQTKDIANILHVHERTAQTHRYRVRRKLGLTTEANLASFLAAI